MKENHSAFKTPNFLFLATEAEEEKYTKDNVVKGMWYFLFLKKLFFVISSIVW